MSDVTQEPADETSYTTQESSNQSIVPGAAGAALVKQSEWMGTVGQQQQTSVGVLLNATRAPKKNETTTATALPDPLPEVEETAYNAGVASPVTLVLVDGKFLMEKATGYDFILMRRAAQAEAKITLSINSAFRSMTSQTAIYADHQEHPEKGPAAKPGFSNHQRGLSLDIHTGISFSDWKSGKVTTNEIHTWLANNAHRFGFDQRDLGKLPDGRAYEPWHWTHASDQKIYGLVDAEAGLRSALADVIESGDGSAYNANGEPDVYRLVLKYGSDSNRSWERSARTSTATRPAIYGAAAAYAAMQSAEKLRRSARQLYPLELKKPLGFSTNPPLYDFETGRWTDEGTENGLGV